MERLIYTLATVSLVLACGYAVGRGGGLDRVRLPPLPQERRLSLPRFEPGGAGQVAAIHAGQFAQTKVRWWGARGEERPSGAVHIPIDDTFLESDVSDSRTVRHSLYRECGS